MSDTGVMISRKPFNMGLQMSSVQSQQPVLPGMHSPFGTDGLYNPAAAASPTYQPSIVGVTGNAGAGESAREGFVDMNAQGEPVKRKRGRPRKYDPDGSMALPPAVPSAVATQSSGGFSPPPTSVPNCLKKARGRPLALPTRSSVMLWVTYLFRTPL